MSRGPGRTQRAILDTLTAVENEDGVRWSDTHTLVAAVYGHEAPSEAQYVAVRRAVRRLGDTGWIDVQGGGPKPLKARRLLTDEERADEERREALRAEWFRRFMDEFAAKVDGMLRTS